MNDQPIDAEALRRMADETRRGYVQLTGPVLALLLNDLTDTERRATQAEAQSAVRGRAVAIYQQRAREAEAQVADTLALCDEWEAMGTRSMNIGAVRRALGGKAGKATALARAEARTKAVRDVLDRWEAFACGDLDADDAEGIIIDIRRALEG